MAICETILIEDERFMFITMNKTQLDRQQETATTGLQDPTNCGQVYKDVVDVKNVCERLTFH